MDDRLDFIIRLAREAGMLAQTLRATPGGLQVGAKAPGDFVTAADLAVERLIRNRIAARWPTDAVLGEEGGLQGDSGAIWITDPIDGTANFMRGAADWGVSIALAQAGRLTHGVIYLPDHGLLVAAGPRGLVAEGAAAGVSGISDASAALVHLGYSPREAPTAHAARIGRILSAGAQYRRSGAATVGLMAVILGRAEVYHESCLHLWDCAAALVIVPAAGGQVQSAPLTDHLVAPCEVLAHSGHLPDLVAAVCGLARP